jgi:hypothetical protein
LRVGADLPQRQRRLDAHRCIDDLVDRVLLDELAHLVDDAAVEQALLAEHCHRRRTRVDVVAADDRLQDLEHVVAVGRVLAQLGQRQRRAQPLLRAGVGADGRLDGQLERVEVALRRQVGELVGQRVDLGHRDRFGLRQHAGDLHPEILARQWRRAAGGPERDQERERDAADGRRRRGVVFDHVLRGAVGRVREVPCPTVEIGVRHARGQWKTGSRTPAHRTGAGCPRPDRPLARHRPCGRHRHFYTSPRLGCGRDFGSHDDRASA